MKKILFLLAITATIIACDKEDEVKVFRLDPDAKVYVKPREATPTTKGIADQGHLTPLEVVKQAVYLIGYREGFTTATTWTWTDKDTVSLTPALLRRADDIIYDADGYGSYQLQPELITARHLVICKGEFKNPDTIAYIPNDNMVLATAAILSALEAKDTTAVYDIFKNAFTFIPITGAEYKELKELGLN